MRRVMKLSEYQVGHAGERDIESVRRLAKFVGVEGHRKLPLCLLIQELQLKGVVKAPWGGLY